MRSPLSSKRTTPNRPTPEEDRVSDFELKLMDIDSEHLGIPDTDYCATVTMPAAEYARIMKDLSSIGDTGEGRGGRRGCTEGSQPLWSGGLASAPCCIC